MAARTFTRRTAVSGAAAAGVAVALRAVGGPASVRADTATPEGPPGAGPNTFSLEGAGTHITYGTTSLDGQPVLSYRGAYPDTAFRGEEIAVGQDPALGPTVSVLLHAEPDARVVYLTLLLPEIGQTRLGDPPVAFSTIAILTTHLTSIGGPALVTGARQIYEVIALAGTARFVES
jgi:hypothetical protein